MIFINLQYPILNLLQQVQISSKASREKGHFPLPHPPFWKSTPTLQGRIQDIGKGGGGGLINIFTTGGGYGRGSAPFREVWGSADSSPSGVWSKAPAAFLLLRLFSMKLTVISIHIHVHHAISGLLEPAWIATRKLFILHNAIKFLLLSN